jgi:flagellar motility protein MotE (MotC chaperone)
MSKPIEMALLGLGGTSLFAVCFLGFASVTGVPMHTLPLVGTFFPAPEQPEPDEPERIVPDPTRMESLMPQQRLSNEDRRVLESNIASLGGWILPPPFEAEELGKLVGELRLAQGEVARREQELEARESQIAEEMLSIGQRSAVLDQMRQELDQREAELERRRVQLEQLAGSLQRTDLVRDENTDRELTRKSLFFAEGEAADAATRLAAFPADEAAAILKKLDETRAIEILNALPDEKWQAYMEAYSRAEG